MKQTGKILISLACGLAFSAISRADNAGAPAGMPAPGISKQLLEKLRQHHPGMKMTLPGDTQSAVTQPKAAPVNTAAAGTAPASTAPAGPYDSIVARNVFGLNPIPPPPVDQADPTPAPKITLTGITTIFGPKEALFKVSGVVKDGKPPQDVSYILTEGEMQDEVTVTAIDMDKNIVTFNNHGVVQQIPLAAGVASGGQSSGSAPSGGPAPNNNFANRFGRPGFGGVGGPGGPGGPSGPGGFGGPRQRFEQRFGNGGNAFNSQGGMNNSYNPQAQYNTANATYNPNANANANANNNPANQLSGDDQAALIAAEHAQAIANNKVGAPVFPPTKYDQDAGVPMP